MKERKAMGLNLKAFWGPPMGGPWAGQRPRVLRNDRQQHTPAGDTHVPKLHKHHFVVI